MLVTMLPYFSPPAKFKEGMKNTNRIPRTVDQFEHVTEAATDSALKVC